MPSFDTVCEPDMVEVKNAVENAAKEIGTRFDFKGSSALTELADRSAKDRELTLYADSDFQLQQVRDVLLARLAKRNVDARFLDFSGTPQKLGGDRLKLAVPVKRGARDRGQARRPAGRDGAAAQGTGGPAAVLRQFPRVKRRWRTTAVSAAPRCGRESDVMRPDRRWRCMPRRWR